MDIAVELSIPWGNIGLKSKTAGNTVAFKLPKSTTPEWAQVNMELYQGQYRFGSYEMYVPIARDSSKILYINAMNPVNTDYFEAGDSMSLQIRYRFPFGYRLGLDPLIKNNTRNQIPFIH